MSGLPERGEACRVQAMARLRPAPDGVSAGTFRHPVRLAFPIPMRADLHMHSTASDGRRKPAALVQEAVAGGLDLIALTDHDTLMGWPELRDAGASAGIECVPGVEISARQGRDEVHLVAYGFDPEHDALSSFLDQQQHRRNQRAESFMERLKDAGAIPRSASLAPASTGTSWARPHVAQVLIEHGAVSSMDEAFSRFLIQGTDTYVEKPLPPGAEAIRVVHEAGGVICMAHPGHHASHQVVMGLVAAGLDGIEVVHPSHDSMLEEYYASLATRFGLLKSGGSDYHARDGHGEQGLGARWFSPEPALLEAIRTQ